MRISIKRSDFLITAQLFWLHSNHNRNQVEFIWIYMLAGVGSFGWSIWRTSDLIPWYFISHGAAHFQQTRHHGISVFFSPAWLSHQPIEGITFTINQTFPNSYGDINWHHVWVASRFRGNQATLPLDVHVVDGCNHQLNTRYENCIYIYIYISYT